MLTTSIDGGSVVLSLLQQQSGHFGGGKRGGEGRGGEGGGGL